MLNYIWGGLIISSFLFAIGYDARDLAVDRYRNGAAFPVEISFPSGFDPDARESPVQIRVDPAGYAAFYGVEAPEALEYPGSVIRTEAGFQLRFDAGASFPEPLATIAGVSASRDGELQGAIATFLPPPAGGAIVTGVRFEQVRFVKLAAISAAALSFAETAAEIALGLIGVLALFLGLLKIAEAAGIVQALVRFVRPLLRPLFPGIPDDHPALGLIALNLTANVFGLGNAATPFGIRAMQEMQTLNPSKDTATNAMVTFLAVNTASVQLLPPVLLIALMGLQINGLVIPIILATGLSLLFSIVAVKVYERLPGSRISDPERGGATLVGAGGAGSVRPDGVSKGMGGDEAVDASPTRLDEEGL